MQIRAGSAERQAGPLGDGRPFDELGQRLIECGAAKFQADDRSFRVDQEGGRDRVDAEGLDEVTAAAGVVDLSPRDLPRLDEVEAPPSSSRRG